MHSIYKLVIVAFILVLLGCDTGGADATGGPVTMRRLTAEQYRNAIEDTFGAVVEVAGRFEPDSRRDGLNALGASLVAVTPSGFEQYEAMARKIAGQVTSVELRTDILPCEPASVDLPDDGCTARAIRQFGRVLLRRPMESGEIEARTAAARAVATEQQDFYAGLRLALISLMVTPDFLFRIEQAAPAPLPDKPNRLVLTDLSLASKLSYFLWNRGPDEELLAAAERGDLADPVKLTQQVDRMLASDHLTDGVRAFFQDVFIFDLFDDLDKDVTHYPQFSNNLAADAREQTLRFVVDQLLTQQGDYRTLFTSRELPMTRSLGPIYGVPVRTAQGWEDASMPAGQSRAGLLSHASFAMLFSHPGRSSPTLRGVFMREALLCQTIPEAPADVDFTQFSQDARTVHKTARDRLQVHSNQASCNKCHVLTDPIGLGLENLDGIGKFRTTENQAEIDASGDFDGVHFNDAAELGAAFAQSDLVGACLVQNLYRYAVGRKETNGERPLLRYLESAFAEQGHQLLGLMRNIATSEAFRTSTAPREAAASRPDKNAGDNQQVSTSANRSSA